MTEREFDVVIVGAGVAGALTAKRLTEAGLDVLVLEAGPSSPQSISGYDRHLRTFYEAYGKGPESAWPAHQNAPQADTANLRHNDGYFVQQGPDTYGSSYSRLQGGSTLHWLGVSLRMLPEDLEMKTRFGVGRDWPIGYDDIEPFYRKAELEMGISADVEDQEYHGIRFPQGYDFPMQRVPQSYADQKLGAAVDGKDVSLGEFRVPLRCAVIRQRATPCRVVPMCRWEPWTPVKTDSRQSLKRETAVREIPPVRRSVRFRPSITPERVWPGPGRNTWKSVRKRSPRRSISTPERAGSAA